MNHPFIVGERYQDRVGEYTVVSIGGNQMRIRRDNGGEEECNVTIKARIFQNTLDEHHANHSLLSAGYFRAIGFLGRHADFQAEVPPQSQPGFELQYHMITGTHPVLHQNGYYPIQISNPNDKWGPELRIYFPDMGQILELPPDITVRDGNAPGILRINDNCLWWRLVRLGFRLGTNHDIARIRESIPLAQRKDFDAGYGS